MFNVTLSFASSRHIIVIYSGSSRYSQYSFQKPHLQYLQAPPNLFIHMLRFIAIEQNRFDMTIQLLLLARKKNWRESITLKITSTINDEGMSCDKIKPTHVESCRSVHTDYEDVTASIISTGQWTSEHRFVSNITFVTSVLSRSASSVSFHYNWKMLTFSACFIKNVG